MLCRRYGATAAYTPMMHARLFSESDRYRAEHLSTCAEDRPLFVQFCANDPEVLVQAAKHVDDGSCDYIDLNFGCPQRIAKRGYYGAFLMDDLPCVASLISALHEVRNCRNALHRCSRLYVSSLVTRITPGRSARDDRWPCQMLRVSVCWRIHAVTGILVCTNELTRALDMRVSFGVGVSIPEPFNTVHASLRKLPIVMLRWKVAFKLTWYRSLRQRSTIMLPNGMQACMPLLRCHCTP